MSRLRECATDVLFLIADRVAFDDRGEALIHALEPVLAKLVEDAALRAEQAERRVRELQAENLRLTENNATLIDERAAAVRGKANAELRAQKAIRVALDVLEEAHREASR